MAARLGIVAGGGTLPKRLIDSCRASDRPFFVVALEGQADPAVVADAPHAWVRLGAAGEAIARLRAEGCAELVFAGSVRRPSLADLRPDGWTAWFLARTGAFALGDDGLLAALAGALEREEGFRVVAPETIVPELLAREGAYGRLAPTPEDHADIAAAIAAALDLGARDQGQAAVARDGYVVTLEHADGTDAMLARLAEEPPPAQPKGVLAKVKKPGQEARIDLPTIGPETVRLAARAGLSGIVIEAGGALVVEPDELARAADESGVFVTGMRVTHPPAHPIRPPPPPEGPLIFLVAGEPSGDALGARLMAALKSKTGSRVRFAGVGGEKMAAEGLVSLFPMREIAVMGLLEVLPRIPNILARIDETVERAEHYNPDAVVTIDSPDFSFRVARRLKGLDFPLIHYVAPTVWAWRPGRARKIARFLDRLIALLPFEPPYFEREGLACTFVGHPVLESGAGTGDGKGFRARHDIPTDAPVLCVLPGSRRSEVRALLAPMGVAVRRVARDVEGLRVIVPTLSTVADDVRTATAAWPGIRVVEGEHEKYDAFAAADAALAASGTVSLELAMAGLPHAIAYKVNPITAWIARRLIRVRFVNLVNLVLERAAVPELLQEDCTGERLAETALRLLRDKDARKTQTDAFTEALRRLGQEQGIPSERAAEVVLEAIAEYSRTP
ncbi:MAG: lipid-A-disaccharide synthase [Rhodospirillales bacterium]|nr:lipid-A-disaccharide synthase [Rhodospirillales bacterium]